MSSTKWTWGDMAKFIKEDDRYQLQLLEDLRREEIGRLSPEEWHAMRKQYNHLTDKPEPPR